MSSKLDPDKSPSDVVHLQMMNGQTRLTSFHSRIHSGQDAGGQVVLLVSREEEEEEEEDEEEEEGDRE